MFSTSELLRQLQELFPTAAERRRSRIAVRPTNMEITNRNGTITAFNRVIVIRVDRPVNRNQEGGLLFHLREMLSSTSQRELSRSLAIQPDQVAPSENQSESSGRTGLELQLQSNSDDSEYTNFDRDGLQRSFECSFCRRILSAPIRMCSNGHLLCSNCCDQMLICRLCDIVFFPIRMHGVEAMLENFTLPCFYKEDGCTLILRANERIPHAKTCMYRPIKCDAHDEPEDCENKLIQFRFYGSHMLQTHNLHHTGRVAENKLEIMLTDDDISINAGLWPLHSFSYDGQSFLIRNFIEGRVFNAWCTIMGTESDAKKYRVNIYFKGTLDENDESLNALKVQKDLAVYSPHIQDLNDMRRVGGTPFRIPIASLQQTGTVTRFFGQLLQLPIPGDSQYSVRYSWRVAYEFIKLPENSS